MDKFNIRVYGLLVNEKQEILLSDEFIFNKYYTKFPGGGLEFGEGLKDCLKREFKEETNLEVTVGDHFYTTDFFQVSAFNTKQQIISVYYWVHCHNYAALKVSEVAFDFDNTKLKPNAMDNAESFRFMPIHKLTVNHVTLPIDKIVVEKLLQYYSTNAGV